MSYELELQDLRLVRDKFTHVSRGFAFVHFHTVGVYFVINYCRNELFFLFFLVFVSLLMLN